MRFYLFVLDVVILGNGRAVLDNEKALVIIREFSESNIAEVNNASDIIICREKTRPFHAGEIAGIDVDGFFPSVIAWFGYFNVMVA